MYRNKSGSFYIPVFDPEGRGHRADVDRSECNTTQVTRFEPESDEIDHDMLGESVQKKKGLRP
jgi:hypothetical protein